MTKRNCLNCKHNNPCHYCHPKTFDHCEPNADAPAPTMSDEQVVERFNELFRENKVAAIWNDKDTHDGYRLRPTPRYRAFNTSDSFKVDEFDGMIICNRLDPNKTDKVRAIFCGGFNLESGRDITWDEAVSDWLTDTGEPFGVKCDD